MSLRRPLEPGSLLLRNSPSFLLLVAKVEIKPRKSGVKK
jgi:hypothetical protein